MKFPPYLAKERGVRVGTRHLGHPQSRSLQGNQPLQPSLSI